MAIAQVTMLRSVSIAVNICTGLLTAALLGPQGRGELAALIVAPQILAGLATLGLHGSLIYNVKADPENERQYISINLLLTFCVGLVAMVVGWFLEPLWLTKYSSNIIELGRAFLVVTPLISASSTFTAVLEARARFVAANQSAYLQSVCTLVVLGLLIALKHLTPATAAAAYLGPSVLVFAYLAVLVGYRDHCMGEPSRAAIHPTAPLRCTHLRGRCTGNPFTVSRSNCHCGDDAACCVGNLRCRAEPIAATQCAAGIGDDGALSVTCGPSNAGYHRDRRRGREGTWHDQCCGSSLHWFARAASAFASLWCEVRRCERPAEYSAYRRCLFQCRPTALPTVRGERAARYGNPHPDPWIWSFTRVDAAARSRLWNNWSRPLVADCCAGTLGLRFTGDAADARSPCAPAHHLALGSRLDEGPLAMHALRSPKPAPRICFKGVEPASPFGGLLGSSVSALATVSSHGRVLLAPQRWMATVLGSSLQWWGAKGSASASTWNQDAADIAIDFFGCDTVGVSAGRFWRVVDDSGEPILNPFCYLERCHRAPFVASIFLVERAADGRGWTVIGEAHISNCRRYRDLLNRVGHVAAHLIASALGENGYARAKRWNIVPRIPTRSRTHVSVGLLRARFAKAIMTVRHAACNERWAIGVLNARTDSLTRSQILRPDSWIVSPARDAYLADPFPWPGQSNVFLCERYDYGTHLGTLRAITFHREK